MLFVRVLRPSSLLAIPQRHALRRMTTSHGSGTQDPVLIKTTLGSRQFILNRPRHLNALNMEMVRIIWPNLKAWEDSDKVNVILLKGNGRAMCAGGDVKYVVELCKNRDPELMELLDTEYQMFHFIGTMKTPYIAVMDGITMGAGSGLAVHAPFRVATENTRFAMPENAIGLFPDVGASFFLSRLDGQLGTYLGMTGKTIHADDVLYSGIATHLVPSSRLPALEERLAELNSPDHDIVHAIISEFSAETKRNTDSHYTLYGDVRKTIDNCFSYDRAEDIVAALKKDASDFALDARDTILSRSPTSVKLTLHNLRTAAHLDFAECLRHEHALWQKVATHHDFEEGVTAHVIRKERPRWNPSSLDEISHTYLMENYFNNSNGKPLQLLSDKSYHLHPFRKFALPSEKDIQQLILETKPGTTRHGTIDSIIKLHNNRFGICEKIVDVLGRKTNTTTDGRIEWV